MRILFENYSIDNKYIYFRLSYSDVYVQLLLNVSKAFMLMYLDFMINNKIILSHVFADYVTETNKFILLKKRKTRIL
jgi:hypothetical protein